MGSGGSRSTTPAAGCTCTRGVVKHKCCGVLSPVSWVLWRINWALTLLPQLSQVACAPNINSKKLKDHFCHFRWFLCCLCVSMYSVFFCAFCFKFVRTGHMGVWVGTHDHITASSSVFECSRWLVVGGLCVGVWLNGEVSPFCVYLNPLSCWMYTSYMYIL